MCQKLLPKVPRDSPLKNPLEVETWGWSPAKEMDPAQKAGSPEFHEGLFGPLYSPPNYQHLRMVEVLTVIPEMLWMDVPGSRGQSP